MTVQEFMDGFEKANDKEKFVKKHIVNTYVPFSKKLVLSKKLAETVTHGTDGNYIQDSPLRYALYLITLVRNYTDIIVGDNTLQDFDTLDKDGAIDMIVSNIPEREYTQFDTIYHMCLDDVYANERSIQSFLETKIGAFGELLNALDKTVEEGK